MSGVARLRRSATTAAEREPALRPDWTESLALAADLALLGIAVTIASLPLVTAGAALTAGSFAADHVCTHRRVPPLGELARVFVRALLPGLAAVVVVAAAVALLALDLGAVSSGRVPGGAVLVVVTSLVALGLGALALVALARVGATSGRGWRSAVAWSGRLLAARPLVVPAVLAVTVVPVILASAVPVTAPLLVGFALFALHVVVRRLS